MGRSKKNILYRYIESECFCLTKNIEKEKKKKRKRRRQEVMKKYKLSFKVGCDIFILVPEDNYVLFSTSAF